MTPCCVMAKDRPLGQMSVLSPIGEIMSKNGGNVWNG